MREFRGRLMESVRENRWDMIWIHSVHVRINLKYTFKVFCKLVIKKLKIKITLRSSQK